MSRTPRGGSTANTSSRPSWNLMIMSVVGTSIAKRFKRSGTFMESAHLVELVVAVFVKSVEINGFGFPRGFYSIDSAPKTRLRNSQ
jgi:hypothetical protein